MASSPWFVGPPKLRLIDTCPAFTTIVTFTVRTCAAVESSEPLHYRLSTFRFFWFIWRILLYILVVVYVVFGLCFNSSLWGPFLAVCKYIVLHTYRTDERSYFYEVSKIKTKLVSKSNISVLLLVRKWGRGPAGGGGGSGGGASNLGQLISTTGLLVDFMIT